MDKTSELLVQLVKDAINLVKNELKKDISKEYLELAQKIISELMWSPGTLIYFEDTDLLKEAEGALAIIWDNVDEEELWDEAVYNSFIATTIGDYLERAKKLKPTLVSVKPDEQVSAYFQSAMHCWLFGINSASVILCCSIIESLLKQKYPMLQYKTEKIIKDFKELKNYERTLEEFIDEVANRRFIDENTRKRCQDIRILRNKTVHKLKSITSDDAHNAILDTKKIIEQLLK